MLNLQNLSKGYGSQELFDDVSFQMNRGERLGLIGRNGFGKSTLLRLIMGEEVPDSGRISMPNHYRYGHLAQHLHFTKPTVLEETCLGLQPDEEYMTYKAEKILFGLGFSESDMEKPPSTFSGGYQIRINLAKLLVSDPDLLLLDEPTNYLDIVSIRWMKQFLRNWKKEMILITHDRDFMDAVTTHTAIIHRQKIRKQIGGTEALLTQIASEEETYEKTRQNEEKQRKKMEEFIARFKAKASTAARAQSRMRLLEKMPEKEKLNFIDSLDFSFNYAYFEAKNILTADNIHFAYDPQIPLIENLNLRIGAQDRIAIIGRNGRGKSTLLNVLAGELTPQQGEVILHPEASVGFFGQTNINRLNPKVSIEQEIGSVDHDLSFSAVRNICGTMMFEGDLAKKQISVLSGGERSRVLLGKILATPCNLLLLDEPTNHLDMYSIEALVESLQYFEGAVVIVTHDEMILRKLAKRLVIFQSNGVDVYDGTYDEFLERIGWEEENTKGNKNNLPKTNAAPKPVTDEKEERRNQQALHAEQTKKINQYKKDVSKLENDICLLEAEQNRIQDILSQASQSQNINDFVAYSKQLKELEKNIEEKFKLLASVTEKMDACYKSSLQ